MSLSTMTQHNDTQHIVIVNTRRYAECCVLLNFMLNAVVLNAVMLIVIGLNVSPNLPSNVRLDRHCMLHLYSQIMDSY